MIKFIIRSCCCGLFTWIICAHADNTAQVKTNLQKINVKITQLQTQLYSGNHAREQLILKLKETETQRVQTDRELRGLEKNLEENAKIIANLTTEIQHLKLKLNQYQIHLANNVRAWQRIAPVTSLRWILHPETAHILRRQSIYKKYLFAATHDLMRNVRATQSNLTAQQNKLQQELNAQKKAQAQWLQRKQLLNQHQTVHKLQLSALNLSIKTTEETLKTHQKNQRILSGLLSSLAKTSVLQTHTPLTGMKNKLKKPLQIENVKTEKSHQGVVFFAPEGTHVYAIYPGKIVFADWLNGYGYLVIIDHGWGFMSLYANNKSLLKHKGDIVRTKEKIAVVGHSGAIQKSGLYFELRHHGKAVSPTPWWETRSV